MDLDGPVELNIGNVCGGAADEIFNAEIKRIMQNIGDPSTNPESKRSLTLKIEFKPAPDRKSAIVTLTSATKMAAIKSVSGSVFIQQSRPYTEDPRQDRLFAAQPAASPEKM